MLKSSSRPFWQAENQAHSLSSTNNQEEEKNWVFLQVRVYTAQNVQLELGVAKREFLQASVGIRDNKVKPFLLLQKGN
jgi:hypothetical protein